MSGKRNPNWDRVELILALDLYLNHESNTKIGSEDEHEALSAILRKLGIHQQGAVADNFRSPASVELKVSNFRRLNPDDTAGGLSGGSEAEVAVWEEFHDRPEELHELAEDIKAMVNNPKDDSDCLRSTGEEDELTYHEGQFLYRMHRDIERNGAVVKAAKKRAQKKGTLRCCICGFDFEKTYGERGRGFIECHHLVPVSQYRRCRETRADDLVLVCSNCHRMLHRGDLLTPDELRELMLRHSK